MNLGSILLDMGDISGSIAAQREAFAFCERTGTAEGFGRFVLGNVAEALFYSGEWGEAEALAGEGIEHAERTGGQYHEPLFQSIPAELGLVRERHTDQAVAVARSGIEQARERADDQAVIPMYSVSAWTLSRTGHATEARALVDELLQRRRANPTGSWPATGRHWPRWRSNASA